MTMEKDFGYYQCCPVCGGTGRAMNFANTIPSTLDICMVCNGAKIIARPPLLPDQQKQIEGMRKDMEKSLDDELELMYKREVLWESRVDQLKEEIARLKEEMICYQRKHLL
jgi:uncharacterized small protein (DUF1192 family)